MFKKRSTRSRLVAGLAALLLGGAGSVALADYPSKSIDMVIPWPTGGRTDVSIRMIAPYMAKALGQPVIVQNRVGGAGIVGMSAVRDAAPDGYTISTGGIALASIQYQKRNAPSLKDYTWIARTYWTPLVVAVPVDSPFQTARELVDFARANPRKVSHGNSGTGSSTHLASAAMAKKLGITISQVPYKGEGPAVVGLAGGEAAFSLGLMPAFKSLLDAGKLRILGVADTQRSPLFPDVPTLVEQGVDFVSIAFEALHMPNGVSPEVLDKLRSASRQALTDPELRDKLAMIGLSLDYQDAPEFVQWLEQYDRETKELIRELGLLVQE
ncbi:MAG: tripartite tricarboxylate transporter substrate binding protein [Burkholderiaceae bacterium]